MPLRVGGIVLCGGESRRMGWPKAWLPFGQEFLLQRVVRILREVVEPVVIVTAPGQSVPDLPVEVGRVQDRESGRGPLEGLAAGLRWMRDHRCDATYLSSTDVPFLAAPFVRRVVELLEVSHIAVPFVNDRHHPLAAVYRVAILDQVDRLLAQGRLRPVFLFESLPTRVIQARELAEVDREFLSLRNLNTPEEYTEALREAGLSAGAEAETWSSPQDH